MSADLFFRDEARSKAASAVAEAERSTAAEIVISVRRISGHYRSADYLFGFLVSLLMLVLLLFLPDPFDIKWFPFDLAVAFAIGASISANVPPLRRLFVGPKRIESEVSRGAHAAFYEQGISRTKGRTGVLVYLSIFERRAVLVPDVGVDLAPIAEDWNAASRQISEAVARLDLEAVSRAVVALGPVLGRVLPRSEDDVNELPDEMHSA
jgi:putative membrane protein